MSALILPATFPRSWNLTSAVYTSGGAAASVGAAKRRALVFAAQHYLLRYANPPPCRFDVVAIDGGHIEWLRGAFEA